MMTTRTLVNGRMTNPSIAVPKHQSIWCASRNKPVADGMLLRYVDRNSAIPVNLTQFRPAGGQEPLGSERDRIWRCTPSPWRDLLARLGGLRLGFHLAALDEVDLGIEDDHVTFLDAVAYFHLRSQIPCHGHFSDVGVTTLDHGDLQAVAIENDRLGRHQNRRRVMRNVKLD